MLYCKRMCCTAKDDNDQMKNVLDAKDYNDQVKNQ